ncbi:META domain-containing protein [Aliidiomarina sp. Khilg15.8]
MRTTIQTIAGALLVALLSGCATEQESESQVYHCGVFSIEVMPLAGDQLQLTAGDDVYQLQPVEAASGTAYSTGEDDSRVTTFWSHGDTAMLELNSQSMPMCARPGAIIEPFTARGNEPFWHLQVEDGQAKLRQPGENDVEFAVSTSRTDAGSVVRDAEGQLVAEISDRLCSDSMSGMQYPKSVQMTYQNEEYQGCGGLPERLLQGVTWQVQTVGDDAVHEQDVSLYFTADGSVSGGSGCNRYFGRYELTGEGIEIARLGSTKRACADEEMAIEAKYLALLSSVRRFRIRPSSDDDATATLILKSADAEISATY